MLQYYTLDEAAKVLGAAPDQAKKLLDEHRIKQFRDGRGKVRYVASAVDLLARTLGRGSEPELQLGEAPPARTGNSPAPKKATDEVFEFDLGPADSAEVPIGKTPHPKAGDSRKGGPRSPAPKPGSDSDVRLVADGSDVDFNLAVDSGVKLAGEGAPSSKKSKKSPADSDVRMVGMGPPGDSGVQLADAGTDVPLGEQPAKKHSDSDIRLEEAAAAHRPGGDDSHITEEIDLDAEQRKAEEAARARSGKKVRGTQAAPPLPTQSPFELSDADKPADSLPMDDSSDFELTPGGRTSSLELSSGELTAVPRSDEDVEFGDLAPAVPGNSGVNIQKPDDSGIPLAAESGSEELEFELSLESGSTPKPAPKLDDSDSEFELSLAPDSSAEQPALESSPTADSDSEFELTLDDSGGLQPLEADPSASGEGDIFETDFEVPALEEESGSEAVALEDSDTDLESSEFDLALEEGDMASEEESGSQVVALEDEADVDEAAQTVQGRTRRRAAAVADEDSDALEEAGEEVEEEEAPARAGAAAAPAPWGSLPALVMAPCLLVMVLAGLMGYELVRGMVGFQQSGKVSGFLTDSLARQFGAELPKE